MLSKPIFLIGFMGSGKSTFGRKLAQELACTFIDMDTYIEEQSGKTIPQLFAEKGEEYFRQMETEVIEHLSKLEHVVVATGGGAPCFNDNMTLLNTFGTTVYLQLSPYKLAQRLMQDSTERPVLQGKTGEDLLDFITTKLRERELFYSYAHYTVDADKPEMLLELL